VIVPKTAPDSDVLPLERFHKAIECLKSAVRLENYAEELTELRCNGSSLRGVCPVHQGDNPQSFAVYPEPQRWRCFRCDRGGDVVDLAQAVEGHAELWTAMLSLAQRYSIELPERPESWHGHQAHKNKVRQILEESITRSYQRRLYKVYSNYLADIGDPEAHRREAADFWDTCYRVGRICAKRRMGH